MGRFWCIFGIAVLLSLVAGDFTYSHLLEVGAPRGDSDFVWHWLAGKALWNHQNPYHAVVPGGLYDLNAGYLYPLPAAIVTLPFSFISDPLVAASVFAGVSTFLFTLGAFLTGRGRLAAIGGVPFLWAATSGQLSILSVAGVMIPGLGFLALLKPNLGLALFAYKPTWSMAFGTVVLITLSMSLPGWPRDWLEVVRHRTPGNYGSPLMQLGGPLMLLAVMRWRRPEARLLLVMALIPQSLLFYDQLPLILIPKSRNESMLLVIAGFVGYMVSSWLIKPGMTTAQVSQIYGPAIILSLFLPCLAMVLRRSNPEA